MLDWCRLNLAWDIVFSFEDNYWTDLTKTLSLPKQVFTDSEHKSALCTSISRFYLISKTRLLETEQKFPLW